MTADANIKRLFQALRQRFHVAIVKFEVAFAIGADNMMMMPVSHHDIGRRQAGVDIGRADDAQLREEIKCAKDARAPDRRVDSLNLFEHIG